ncbi:hypothetical protein DW921_02755 [Phocaeicola coprophilus]|uniref:Uncharacterized protein n=2 Tax=Phocaeicola coprophilus TaxID=387090 RepID=S0F4G5_9BACT|nr:hypothetical protein BACCOPRO_00500 [Phocaeicola coprophilus DSM 18228 = JCM 13818]RHA77939.1 hypothetical protein DW921_02755 [Phocaeicola coprophilus]
MCLQFKFSARKSTINIYCLSSERQISLSLSPKQDKKVPFSAPYKVELKTGPYTFFEMNDRKNQNKT